MTRIKICGIRRKEDVEFINKVKPDYMGFVFADSKRKVTRKEAEELTHLVAPGIKRVGVFVDQPPELVADLLQNKVIDLVQLHGIEGETYRERLFRLLDKTFQQKKFLIKAIRVKTELDIIKGQAQNWDYLLLDAGQGNAAGGNGMTFDWSLARKVTGNFFLAGGLNAENVQEAIRQVHPWAVDVSSGVETEGKKDIRKIEEFVQAVRTADLVKGE